jgi:hypothetical protein
MLNQLKILLDNIFPPRNRVSHCGKCGGVGWLFGYELDEKPDRASIDSKHCCDHCSGTGWSVRH